MTNPISSDSLKQLIQDRRTCYQYADQNDYPIKDELLYECLEAARWAPNHKLTQPWRFWIIGQQAKADLAHIYAENRALKKADKSTDLYQELYTKAVEKFLAIPKVILVGQALSNDPVTLKEDYAACACAIQNFQLMAWSLKLGVQWSTGPILKDERTMKKLNIHSEKIELIGALYIGYQKPDCQKSYAKRDSLASFLTELA
ncbi:MAG: nitroreductase [Thiotrichales bacterium]|nr:nitroreductase [Thiotrichales bacterium]